MGRGRSSGGDGGIERAELLLELVAHEGAAFTDQHAADVATPELPCGELGVDGGRATHDGFGLVVVLRGLGLLGACAQVLGGVGDRTSDELGRVLNTLAAIVG